MDRKNQGRLYRTSARSPKRLYFFLSFCLETKGPKIQGRHHRSFPRPSKCLTLRSRSDFFEVKRQAPLREAQALSRPLQAQLGCRPSLPAQPGLPLTSQVYKPYSGRLRETFHPCLSAHVIPAGECARHGIYGQKACKIHTLRSCPITHITTLIISNKPDNKRQQTTTVDNKRLINGLVLTEFPSLRQ